MRSRNWKQLLTAALDGVYPALEAMSDAELRLVIRAPKRRTQTNCWWVAYQAAPLLAVIAHDILQMRQQARRQARSLARKQTDTSGQQAAGTDEIRPLNGAKTHPLTKHAIGVLVGLLGGPAPRNQINPGAANRLLRGRLVESVQIPSPFASHKGQGIEHLRLTDAGSVIALEHKEEAPRA